MMPFIEEDVLEPNVHLERSDQITAREVVAGKIKHKTRKSYNKKIGVFNIWLSEIHPDFYDIGAKSPMLPVPADIVAEFLAKISTVTDIKTKERRSASVSHVQSYRSALKFLYEEKNLIFENETAIRISDFSSGYKRLVADKKLNGEMSVQEGKSPITFGGYNFVSQKALEMKEDFHLSLFAHLFLLLCWNLMARSVSVGTIMLQHISWEQDSLLITTPKHKGDQEGNNCYPKHVYANPESPVICPVLSMSLLIFASGWKRDGSKHMLFQGAATESRFSKWLKATIKTCAVSIGLLGMLAFDIGTHSFRKGVATFVAGCPAGPSAINIFLRAGWSLGAVASRYIFTGQGGDQVSYNYINNRLKCRYL